MSFLCWILIGFLGASIASFVLNRKGYPLIGFLFVTGIGSAIAGGLWVTQLGWEWGDAVSFNYRNILAAAVASIVALSLFTLVVNLCFPVQQEDRTLLQ